MADGQVVFSTELDTGGVQKGIQDLDGTINKWGKAIVGSKVFGAVAKGIVSVAKAGVEYNAQMEAYQTNFSVLLGEQAAALEHVAELREMAAKTPFGMEDLASASQTMLSFGLGVDDTMNSLKMLGDISLGNKEKLSALSLAFSQVSAAGKLTGQDLLQMINAGFNPLNTIAEATGTSLGDLKEVMSGGNGSEEFQEQMKAAQTEVKKLGENASEGAKLLAQIGEEGVISAQMVGIAMEMETSPGGRFYNGMEQASKTMSGLVSTLKDDAMQLAGNALTPLSNALTNVVLPAAISAVGALNDLFETDGNIKISAETQEAVDAINSLGTKIEEIKTTYATEAIKVKVEYEESMNLVEELEDLQTRLDSTPRRLWSEQDKEDLRSLTSQLVELNPELAKFVGSDGIINKEAEAVRELITEYKNLAIAKAAQRASEQAWDVYFQAEAEAENLRTIRNELSNARTVAAETLVTWQDIASAAGKSYQALTQFTVETFTGAGIDGFEVMTGYVNSARESLQAYIDLGGDISQLPNLYDYFNGFTVLSADEIMANADATTSLGEAMKVVGEAAFVQEGVQQNTIEQIAADLAAGEAAIAAAEKTAAEALTRAQTWETTVNNIASGVSMFSQTAETANTAIDGVKENAESLTAEPYEAELGVDDQASAGIASVDSKLSELNGKSATVTINYKTTGSIPNVDGSHADGLDYVPFDNYLALLHKGEQVLTAEEAKALRELSGRDYASKLATRSYLGGAENRLAGANETIVNQTINFNVPVQTPDEFAQTMKLYATYGFSGA